ncbi:restriction endonuclease subunit S [Haloimpatiens sp. FM7315]|uniref:restriction endonuclease subunit S n=1 Tax=Haloimpatiens sp. FM7315 TaxID=3298609 RepID=UPI0035A275C5
MEKNKNKPKLRFPEFTEPWEQRKLGEIGEFKNGMNFGKEAMGHGHPFVNLQDIFGKNIVDDSNLGLAESSENQRKEYCLNKGDILFIRSSVKPEGVGEAALVPRDFLDTTYSGFIIRFRPKVKVADKFKKFVFSTKEIRNQIMASATSSANTNINQDSLQKIQLKLPDNEEQEKIGAFFDNIDNLITLHQRKLNHLQDKKKGLLQKMFPKNGESFPELRFQGFTDPWEQRKLGEISDKVTEKNIKNNYYETLTNSAEFGIVSQRDFFDKEISNAKNLDGYYVVKNDDFVYNPRISNYAPVGPIKRNKLGRNGVMSPLYYVFRTHDIDKTYLEHYFGSTRWHNFMKLNGDSGARADRFAIKDSVLREMPIPYPTLEEQSKVGGFLDRLTDLITLHQRKLQHLQKQKKGLLQQMFI